jgi:hypothetical protein
MESEPQEDAFSEEHRQEVLAWAVMYENLYYESLLTRISDATWEMIYAQRKSKPEAEFEAKQARLMRLVERKFLFLNGHRPSKFYK